MASSPFYLPPPSSSTPPPKPTHTRAPSEPIAPVNLNPTAPATRRSFTDYPLTTHLAFLGGLTAIILPISLVPYLLTKRKLSSLQRTVHALESQTTEMQHRLQSAAIANARTTLTTRAARRRMIPLVQAVRMVGQEVQEVKGAMEKDKYERHEREKKNKVARSDLLYLLEEARIARVHGDAIRSLGVPLAEIAAFMHEVELWLPQVEGTKMSMSEKSRVEELRIIALRLQNLPSGQQRSDLQKTLLDKLAEIR